MIKIISIGNPNRLVKVAKQMFKCDDFIGYFFNSVTGEIMEKDALLNENNYIHMLTDSSYPVYEGQNYLGYVYDEKFISPAGVMLKHIDKAHIQKIKVNREELRNLLCSRFR